MAKVANNVFVRGLRGKIGGAVFRQMPDGSTWVSAIPNFSQRRFSKGQKNHQKRFKQATMYAGMAAKTQPIYAELAKGTMKNAYNIALSDWFNPPVVKRIEKRGGRILVEASDNVMVTKVRVTVLDHEGKVLEKGEATRGKGDWWEYTFNEEGKTITAEAWDLAGNVSQLVL